MRRWGVVAAVIVAVLVAPAAQAAPSSAGRPAPLVVSGAGGQAALLSVPAAGYEVEYPFFSEPRLPGPDGTVGGVAIQRVSDGRLVGGTMLLNAPGFDRALGIELVGWGRTRLTKGRYRLTLLGSGRQQVRLGLRGQSRARHLVGRGPKAPITRVAAGSATVVDSWSAELGRTGGGDYVLLGAGAGGDYQQAENTQLCLLPTGAGSDAPCLAGDGGSFISPGAGGAGAWSAMLYPPGTLERAAYTFSGNVIGVGPRTTTGYAGVVISLRQ